MINDSSNSRQPCQTSRTGPVSEPAPERAEDVSDSQDQASDCGLTCGAATPEAASDFLAPSLETRRRRFAEMLEAGPEKMDRDQLTALIRFYSHSMDKVVKCKNTHQGYGQTKYTVLRAALAEWERRGYERGPVIDWVRRVLDRYETWLQGDRKLYEPLVPEGEPRSLELFTVMRERRSVRFWKRQRVEAEKIEKLIEAATQAPSSCNRMPCRYYIVETAWEDIAAGNSTNKSLIKKAPLRIYAAADERLYPQLYAAALDVGLAVQNLCLAAHALGLGACVVYQSESIRQADLKREYGIPEHLNIYCVVLVGYPDESPSRPERPPPSEVYRVIQARAGAGAWIS